MSSDVVERIPGLMIVTILLAAAIVIVDAATAPTGEPRIRYGPTPTPTTTWVSDCPPTAWECP